jgi:hypothetical protein
VRTRNSDQEDYLLRMIQEAGRALARIRELLLGGATASPVVRAEIEQTTALLLGGDRPMLEQLDAESAVRLIGNADRVARWIELLELDAESQRQQGDAARAARRMERARSLRTAVANQFGTAGRDTD